MGATLDSLGDSGAFGRGEGQISGRDLVAASDAQLYGRPAVDPAATSTWQRELTERAQTSVGEIDPGRIAYGELTLAGTLVFRQVSGTNNRYLHLVSVLCRGTIDAIQDLYFAGELVGSLDANGNVNSGTFSGKARIKKYLGTDDQAADPDLVAEVPEWTTDHRLRGWAYVYVRLDGKSFYGSQPEIRATIRGKTVRDPRAGGAVAYANNAALVLADYIAAEYGLRAAVDDAALTAAANTCDELVPLVEPRPLAYQVTLSASTNDYDATRLEADTQAAGWDGTSEADVTLTIAPGVVVGSSVATKVAMDLRGLNANLRIYALVNQGRIQGAGGGGGGDVPVSGNGLDGGAALAVDVGVQCDNAQGQIWAGGGGGRSGAFSFGGAGAGGGGAGTVGGPGGSVAIPGGGTNTGQPGTDTAGGVGGIQGNVQGGAGGGVAEPGGTGQDNPESGFSGRPGGVAGPAIIGDDLVNFQIQPVLTGLGQNTVRGAAAFTVGGTFTQPRYTLDGSFRLDREPTDVLEEMTAHLAGAVVRGGGLYQVRAGADDPAAVQIDESWFADSEDVEITWNRARADVFNESTPVLADGALQGYAGDAAPRRNAYYEGVDGARLGREVELPFCANKTRGQRLAEIFLRRGRNEIALAAAFNLRALRLQPWDPVELSLGKYDLDRLRMRVIRWRLRGDLSVAMTLQAEDVGSYDWQFGAEYRPALKHAPDGYLTINAAGDRILLG